MYYLIHNHLLSNLHHTNLAQWIANDIVAEKPEVSDCSVYCFESLDDANHFLFSIISMDLRPKLGSGFVAFDTSHLKEIKTLEEFNMAIEQKKLTVEQIKDCIVEVHVNSKVIKKEYLDNKKNTENDHLKELQPYFVDDDQLQLTENYSSYLAKIPSDLYYFIFVDYILFDYNGENWGPYENREPGCMADLFRTQIKLLNDLTMSQGKKEISLNYIIGLQKSLSTNLFRHESQSRSGSLKDFFNSFPLLSDAISEAGILEILKRIRKDNDPNGIMLGHFKKSNIISKFILKSYHGIEKNTAIDEISRDIFALFSINNNNDKKRVSTEINSIINVYVTLINVKMEKGSRDLYELYLTAKSSQTKEEYAFDIKYSRQSAMISHHTLQNLLDEELNDITHRIITLIEEDKISLLAPHINFALRSVEAAIKKYNSSISHDQSIEKIITNIVELVHELERMHIFYDANCRTSYHLLNFLLVLNGIKPTMFYNPNRLDAYSVSELVEQVKQGIARYDFVINNQEKLSAENQNINKYFLRYYHNLTRDDQLIYIDSNYKNVSNPLFLRIMNERLITAAKNHEFEKISEIIKDANFVLDVNLRDRDNCTAIDYLAGDEQNKDLIITIQSKGPKSNNRRRETDSISLFSHQKSLGDRKGKGKEEEEESEDEPESTNKVIKKDYCLMS